MNSLTSLPNETLFHCLHGTQEPTVSSICNFGYNCRNLRETCKDLQPIVDKAWKDFVENYWELKDLPSIRSVINWINNKPKFTNPTLQEILKTDFGIEIEPDILTRRIPPGSIPYYWPAEELLVYIPRDSRLEASFFNCKTKKLLPGDTANQIVSRIQPIIHENNVFILAIKDQIPRLCHYTLEQESYSLKNTIPILPSDPSYMLLIHDHIVIHADLEPGRSRLLAISLNDLIHSCTPSFIQSEILCDSTPQKLNSALLIRSKKEEKFCFQTVQIEDGKIEWRDLPTKGIAPFYETYFKNGCGFTSALHIKDKHEVFQFYNYTNIPTFTFGSISPTNELSLIQFKQKVEEDRQLIQFNDGLLSVYSLDKKIKVETVDIVEGVITFTPIPIRGLEKEHFFFSKSYCHLDKLFLIGSRNISTLYKPMPYLLIVNLRSMFLTTLHPIPSIQSQALKIIETTPGRLLIFDTIYNTILKIDYT